MSFKRCMALCASIAALSGLLVACAGTQHAKPGQVAASGKQPPLERTATLHTEHGDITVFASGTIDLEPYRGHTVYIEFMSSPKLGTALRDRFSALGFTPISSASTADVSIKMLGDFRFQKPHANRQDVDLGKVVEQTPQGQTDLLNYRASVATRTPGMELGPLLNNNLSSGMVLGTGIVDSILRLSGVHDWFNKLVAGDERGFCLGTHEMCKDWKKYTQEMRLAAVVTFKNGEKHNILAMAAAKDEQLLPGPLFHASMGELTQRIFPSAVSANQAATQEKESTHGSSTQQNAEMGEK
jgi:hypothetical protein